jgi:hypothetical protein
MSSSETKSKKSKNKNKLSIKIQKKKVFRANEPLISVFMWGINYSVIRLIHFEIMKLFHLIIIIIIINLFKSVMN